MIEPIKNKNYQNENFTVIDLLKSILFNDNRTYESKVPGALNQLLDTLGVLLIVVDVNSDIILTNKKTTQVLGFNKEELTYKNILNDIIVESYKDMLQKKLQRLLSNEAITSDRLECPVLNSGIEVVEISWDIYLLSEKDQPQIYVFLGNDIIDQVEFKEALQDSEAIYKNLLDNAYDGIVIVQDRICISANPTFARIIGYPREEVVGKSFTDFVHPDSIEVVVINYNKRLNGETVPKVYETTLLKKNGSSLDVDLQAVKIKYRGKPAVLGYVRNIHDRKMAEQANRESQERYRHMFTNNHATMLLVDPDTVDILDANFAACDFYGYSKEDLIQMKMSDITVNPLDEIFSVFTRARDGANNHFYFSQLLSNNVTKDVEVYSGPITFLDKEILYLIIHDVTDRKRIEEQLRKNEAMLQSILRAAPIGIGIVRDWVFSWTNKTLHEMTGYFEEELNGKSSRLLYLTESDFDDVGKFINSNIKEKNIGTTKTKWKKKNGKILDVLVSATPINRKNYDVGITFIAIDISELKMAEKEKEKMQLQLLQAQKMEAIGTLAGGIAHDFNNVMAGVVGGVNILDLFLEEEELKNPDKINEYIGVIQDSSKRASEMVRQLLTISRSGKEELNFTPVDLNMSLKHVLKICKNSFPKSIKLDFQSEEKPMRINADPTQVEQVLLNLSVNASHAMTLMRDEGEKQGGTLKIEFQEILSYESIFDDEDLDIGKPYICIKITDNGIGMDEEIRKKFLTPSILQKKPVQVPVLDCQCHTIL